MYKIFNILLTGLLLTVSSAVHATLIDADYAITGDNQAVLDTNTNLLWLDLTLTDGMTKESALTTYSGFRLATSLEYQTMFASWFNTYSNFDINQSYLTNLNDNDVLLVTSWRVLFGNTASVVSYGWIETPNSEVFLLGGVYIASPQSSVLYTNYLKTYANNSFKPHSSIGWFLVKDLTPLPQFSTVALFNNVTPVPEPSTAALFILAIVGVLFRQRNIKSSL